MYSIGSYGPKYFREQKDILDNRFVKTFNEKYPQYGGKVDLDLIKKIVKSFNTKLRKTVSETRDGIEFPERMGHVFLGACSKPVVPAKNINFFNKTGIRAIYRNDDTNEYLAKVFFINYPSRYNMKYKKYWNLEAGQKLKEEVSRVFKVNWMRFISINNRLKIRTNLQQNIQRLKAQDLLDEQSEQINKYYNEFD